MSLAFCYFSRCLESPTQDALVAARRVLRYLHTTKYLGIRYTIGAVANVHGMVDSDWAVDKSTSGYVFSLVADAVFAWLAKGQLCIAMSSTEAEIMAASLAALDRARGSRPSSCGACCLRRTHGAIYRPIADTGAHAARPGRVAARIVHRRPMRWVRGTPVPGTYTVLHCITRTDSFSCCCISKTIHTGTPCDAARGASPGEAVYATFARSCL